MRKQAARKELSATNLRNLRTLLLLNVFAPEEIGGRIAQAREEAGLRQEDLADLIEVATRTVQNYEAGSTKPFAKLRSISEATGKPIEWLLHGDPAEPVSRDEEVRALREELAEVRGMVAQLLDQQQPAQPARKARRRSA